MDQSEAVAQFMELTGSNETQSTFYLECSGGDLNQALSLFHGEPSYLLNMKFQAERILIAKLSFPCALVCLGKIPES